MRIGHAAFDDAVIIQHKPAIRVGLMCELEPVDHYIVAAQHIHQIVIGEWLVDDIPFEEFSAEMGDGVSDVLVGDSGQLGWIRFERRDYARVL